MCSWALNVQLGRSWMLVPRSGYVNIERAIKVRVWVAVGLTRGYQRACFALDHFIPFSALATGRSRAFEP